MLRNNSLLSILREFIVGKHHYVDLRGCVTLALYEERLNAEHQVNLDQYLLTVCQKEGNPVLFHFDELGNWSPGDLRALRDSCSYCYAKASLEMIEKSFFSFTFQVEESHIMISVQCGVRLEVPGNHSASITSWRFWNLQHI